MKERGMIFNAEMVRAILDGRKTQTRRVVKGVDGAVGFSLEWDINGEEIFVVLGEKDHTGMNPVLGAISCQFGAVGDRIWVRETFSVVPDHDEPAGCSSLLYAADGVGPYGKWTPSIHMPRWASRILLEITNVRVERLNDISEEDAKAEGAPTECCVIGDKHFLGFRSLWKSIYGEESWRSNPWVWAIEFKRVEGGAA